MAFALVTCRPDIGLDSDDLAPASGYDFSKIFETFWRGMDRNYLFWSEEPSSLWDPVFQEALSAGAFTQDDLDIILKYPESFWSQIYNVYKPQFEALGVFASVYEPGYLEAATAAYGLFFEMIHPLRDGHLQMSFNPEAMPLWDPTKDPSTIDPSTMDPLPPMSPISPVQTRVMGHYSNNDPLGAEAVFSQSNLTENTPISDLDAEVLKLFVYNPETEEFELDGTKLGTAYFATYDFVGNNLAEYLDTYEMERVTAAGLNINIVRGKITHTGGGHIAYLHFNSCQLMNLIGGTIPGVTLTQITAVSGIINRFIGDLADTNVKGVIVDLRGNIGGDPRDIGNILGRMIGGPLTYAHTRSKSGEGRLDYTPWVPMRLMPAPASEKRLANYVPVVAVVNKGTMSSAEFMTMAVKSMPNGIVVGDTTMGAASFMGDVVPHNGGGFSGGPFWTQVSGGSFQTRFNDTLYEGFGLPPDIHVPMTRSDWEDFYGSNKKDKQMEAAVRVIDPGHSF
jgi:hypothetical protein